MCKDLLSSVVETDFFELIKSIFWATFLVKWATFGQLLKILGATFERYPSNLCKSLYTIWTRTYFPKSPISDYFACSENTKVSTFAVLSALNKSEILVESLRRDPIYISGFRSFEVHPQNRSVLSILSHLMKPCYFRRTNLKWHALPHIIWKLKT